MTNGYKWINVFSISNILVDTRLNPTLRKSTPPCIGNPTLIFENGSSPQVEHLLKIAKAPPYN